MRKSGNTDKLNPRHRVLKVNRTLQGSLSVDRLDQWERKLYDMYKLRSLFKDKYPNTWWEEFSYSYPLFCSLLDVYEQTSDGGSKDVLEAALLASIDCSNICRELDIEEFSPLFLTLYRELFFDVVPILGNAVNEFKYLISPMIHEDSDRLHIGSLWKLLALLGGLSTLKRKGFGTEAIKAEDLAYLLQLAAYRNCSTLLQYVSKGLPMFEQNPAAASILSTLAEFDGIRGAGRRLDYFAEVSAVAKNNLSVLLSNDLRLLSAPTERVAELSVLDGVFNTGREDIIERTNHINFLEYNQEVDSEN